jgi:hypothetical protein
MLSILSAQLKNTATDQATTAPSTAGVVSPKTQGLIEALKDQEWYVREAAAWALKM